MRKSPGYEKIPIPTKQAAAPAPPPCSFRWQTGLFTTTLPRGNTRWRRRTSYPVVESGCVIQPLSGPPCSLVAPPFGRCQLPENTLKSGPRMKVLASSCLPRERGIAGSSGGASAARVRTAVRGQDRECVRVRVGHSTDLARGVYKGPGATTLRAACIPDPTCRYRLG